MKLQRPVIFAIVGLIAVVALFVYTRSMGNNEGEPAGQSKNTPSNTTTTPPQTTESTPSTTTTVPQPGEVTPPTTTPSPDSGQPQDEPTPLSVPPEVADAMLQHKVVVVLFWDPAGADDIKVKEALDELRQAVSASSVAIFEEDATNIARYSLIAKGVDRSPAVVVVDPTLKTRLVQGYVDSTSLEQMVNEAMRAGQQ